MPIAAIAILKLYIEVNLSILMLPSIYKYIIDQYMILIQYTY